MKVKGKADSNLKLGIFVVHISIVMLRLDKWHLDLFYLKVWKLFTEYFGSFSVSRLKGMVLYDKVGHFLVILTWFG